MKSIFTKISRTLFAFGMSALIIAGCGEQTKKPEEKVNGDMKKNTSLEAKPAFDVNNMDKTIKPGDNFYKYVNGEWMKKNPIPAEYSRYGVFNILQDENFEALKTIFEEAAAKKDAKAGSMEQKIGDFYASGLDINKINEEGLKPLESEFKKIADIKDYAGVQEVAAHLHTCAVFPFFYIFADQDEKNSDMVVAGIYQGGIGLPDRDYYLNDDPRSKEIRDAYLIHLEKMFVLMGDSEEDAKKAAKTIMDIETGLAKVSFTRTELREPEKNYNKVNVDGLQKIAPAIEWKKYFADLGLEEPGDIIAKQIPFVEGFSKLYKKVSVEDWKTYLRWNLINSFASYLSKDFVDQNFDFYGKTLTGSEKIKPRWKRVLSTTSGSLGELVGQLYVKKYFPPEAKERMLDLVGNLKKSFHQRIENLDWMSDATKEKALAKLDKMNVKIGYPDKWIDYSSLEVTRESYVMNVMRAHQFAFNYDLKKVGKPVDRGEWGMTPQTINAYYNPVMNEIVFPAAILQPPFFNLNADDAVNYAAIGTIIGHEMTHGFDDQGRLYNVEGNLGDWWTAEDAKNFKEKTQVLVDQYNKFGVELEGQMHNLNGEMTLGENIADFGGITISLNAYKQSNTKDKEIDGFTPLQRFFLSYAQIWRQNIRDKELMRRIKEDVHSPGRFRVNGVVPNVPEFYEAFEISEGQPLYKPENERAIIW